MTICVCVSISPLKTWTCFILYSKGQLDKTCSSKLPHPSGTERDYTSFSFFPPFVVIGSTPLLIYVTVQYVPIAPSSALANPSLLIYVWNVSLEMCLALDLINIVWTLQQKPVMDVDLHVKEVFHPSVEMRSQKAS